MIVNVTGVALTDTQSCRYSRWPKETNCRSDWHESWQDCPQEMVSSTYCVIFPSSLAPGWSKLMHGAQCLSCVLGLDSLCQP